MINLTYDIVGSFLRPEEIKEARKNFKEGQISREQLTQIEDHAIEQLVEKRSCSRSEICYGR